MSQQGVLPHTLAPQGDTLLFVSLTDAVITVAVHVVAGVAIMQVDVGGAVRACTGAELREVTRVTGFTAWGACWFQLHSNVDSIQQSLRQMKLRQVCAQLNGLEISAKLSLRCLRIKWKNFMPVQKLCHGWLISVYPTWQSWQHCPCAQTASPFRVQVVALQQGFIHSFRCIRKKKGSRETQCKWVGTKVKRN